ncbi:MAG: hypothetical protein OCD00_11640 [Colwellia sp.]
MIVHAEKLLPLLLLFSFVLSFSVQAKQLNFSKKANDDSYTLRYQWLDANNVQQTMTFSLSKEALFDRFRNFKTYKSTFAEKFILKSIKKQLKQTPFNDVKVSFHKNGDKVNIQINGTDNKKVDLAYKNLQIMEQKATTLYFQENHYLPFVSHDQIHAIKVDHVSIANIASPDLKPLKPLILEKVSIKNIRKVTDFVLSFIQNIPYSALESRITSSGAGFNHPLKVLWENQGDCDSKMTLTAALLRSLMPRIDMVMIYIDKHAFIGIAIPVEADEVAIKHNGITYLLAEPTGPALLRLGQLAPESELAINQGRYVVETFHAKKSESDAP